MVQQIENISQPSRKIRIISAVVIVILNVVVVGGILFVGLWPFNFLPENGCNADAKSGRLLFERSGIAYRKLDISACRSLFNNKTFSLAFSVQPFNSPVYCATILALPNNKKTLITINQWKSTLIVQSGSCKVAFGNVMKEKVLIPVMLTIVDSILTLTCSNITKTVLIDNSDLKNGMLQYIIFGNNASLHSPWKGVLSSIRFNKSNDSFQFIQVPRQMIPLKATMLTPPWNDYKMELNYAMDLIINLLGFVPLGLSLCLLLNNVFSMRNYRYLAILLSFLISLFIEMAQAYLITRTSQMSDLILNSWGGLLGTVLYVILMKLVGESSKVRNHQSPGAH
jgi:VanZ family protein